METNQTRPLLARARDFTLASLALEYPGQEVIDTLTELKPHLASHDGLGPLTEAVHQGLRQLQNSYAQLFENGKSRVSLYETEHGPMRGAAKGNDLADIAGFYQAFQLAQDDETVHEMLDHVAVELEFYGHLLLKQYVLTQSEDAEGCAIVEDARRKFLESHLGRFVDVIAQRPSVRGDAIYGPALAWCARVVAEECAALGVQPPPLDFFPDAGDRDDTSCGAVRLPVLN
jgi:nitrate reductase assembly molybdenum cofactor insertion protein NarJ